MEKSFKNQVSLGAILKNSVAARGGGIYNFIEHISPYVHEMVLNVDSKTNDNTREAIQSLIKKGYNIRQRDFRFDNFSQARNLLINGIRTPWILMLDDDERILGKDMEKLISLFEEKKDSMDAFNFDYDSVDPTGIKVDCYQSNPRLFKVKGVEFLGQSYEYIKNQAKILPREMDSGVVIRHFIPLVNDYYLKHNNLRVAYK